MAGLNMSQGSLLDVLKKKMRQTKDEMERSKDECEELQKKLHMEVMRREEVSLWNSILSSNSNYRFHVAFLKYHQFSSGHFNHSSNILLSINLFMES